MSLGLHDPTVAQPAEPAFAPSPVPTIQSEALRLTTLKDSITSRLDVYFEVLKTNNVTMATPLVDPEGFPRADIDVAGVRTARMQINRLRNDLKAVMNEMGQLLERGLPREEVQETGEKDAAASVPMEVEEDGKVPFAKVDGVFPASPAAIAGLERGDLIVSLGTVNSSNHDSLKGLAALVGQSEGMSRRARLITLSPSTLLPTPASLTSLPFELKLAIAHLVRASDIVAKAREEELDDECIGNYEVVEAMPRSIIATNEWGQGLKMLCMTSRAWNAACSQVRVEAITSRHFCEESGHQRILRQYGAFARKITFLGLETRPDHFNKLEHADALEIHEYMEREVGNLPEMLAFLPNVISVSLRHHLVETLYKAMESETAGTASDEDKARIAALRSVLERAEDVKVSLSQHSPTLQIGALLLILRRCRRAHFHGESSPFQEYNKLAWLGMQRIRSNLKHLTFEIEESDPEPVDVKWIEWAREHDDWALESLVIKVAYSSYGEPSRWFLTSNTVDFIAATSSSLEALTIVAPAGVDSNARFTAAYPRLRKLSLTCPLDMAEAFTSSLHASPLAVLELASSDLELPRSILTALPSLTHVTAHTATLAAENEMRKRGIVYVETKE
ncbi:hypothetical protein RQP46_000423 [Phenoliferia psychrophenolica]